MRGDGEREEGRGSGCSLYVLPTAENIWVELGGGPSGCYASSIILFLSFFYHYFRVSAAFLPLQDGRAPSGVCDLYCTRGLVPGTDRCRATLRISMLGIRSRPFIVDKSLERTF